MTIFKPDEADASLIPLPIVVEPIHPPAADDSPEDEDILLVELSVGSSTGPVLAPTKTEPSTKSVLKMKGADKMALLKNSKKSSVRISSKAVLSAPPKPTPPPATIMTLDKDSENTEDRPLEPPPKKPRLIEGLAPVDAVVVPVPESTPTSKTSSSQGSPTTCWPKGLLDKFPFHMFDHFKLSGDEERFKNYSLEEFLVTYIRAQTQVLPTRF